MSIRCLEATMLCRFSKKFTKTESCWFWTAATHAKGYGFIGGPNGNELAHRASYRLHKGPVPDGYMVLHRCDTPACVNPEHLFLGTNADNMQDMMAKGRGNKPCGEQINLAKLTGAAVRIIRNSQLSNPALSELFGVHLDTIQRARTRKTWRHI